MYWTNIHQSARKFSSEKRKQRQMGLLISLVLILLVYLKFWNSESNFLLLALACIPAMLGFILPVVLKPILYLWMVIGQILGDIMSTVIISAIYLVMITPISFFVKKKSSKGWIKKKSGNFDLEKMY